MSIYTIKRNIKGLKQQLIEALDEIQQQTVKYVLDKLSQGIEEFRLENEEQINGKWYIESCLLIGEITTGLLVDIGREFGIKPFWEEQE